MTAPITPDTIEAVTLEELDMDVKRIVLLGVRLGAMFAGNICKCNREGLLPGEKLCPKCRGIG